jgi:hypothetical protein
MSGRRVPRKDQGASRHRGRAHPCVVGASQEGRPRGARWVHERRHRSSPLSSSAHQAAPSPPSGRSYKCAMLGLTNRVREAIRNLEHMPPWSEGSGSWQLEGRIMSLIRHVLPTTSNRAGSALTACLAEPGSARRFATFRTPSRGTSARLPVDRAQGDGLLIIRKTCRRRAGCHRREEVAAPQGP